VKNIDATVAEVGLLRTFDTAALHAFCSELPLTFTAASASIPLFLKVSANKKATHETQNPIRETILLA